MNQDVLSNTDEACVRPANTGMLSYIRIQYFAYSAMLWLINVAHEDCASMYCSTTL